MARTSAAALVVVAGAVLLLQVQVHDAGTHDAGTTARSCGSAWDVVAGRAGWPEWWSQDLADPADSSSGRLVRTLQCPSAVNDRVIASGILALGAVLLVSTGELVHRRARRGGDTPSGTAARLRLLGTALTLLGGLLTVGGLVGIALLVADPHAPLFLYVSRPVIALAGLLLILPAIVLLALGRGAGLVADLLPGGRARDEDA